MEIDIGIGKTARQAYGLDDIAIVPSRRTRDPDDVDITWQLDGFRFALPMMGSAMDGALSPATATAIGHLGGLGVLNLEGLVDPIRGSRAVFRGDRRTSGREGHPAHAGDLPRADQGRTGRPAGRRDEGREDRHRRQPHPAAGSRPGPGGAGSGPRHPGHPGDRGLRRARLDQGRAAQPQAVHRRLRRPGDRRGLRLLQHRPPSDENRGRRGPGRRRARGCLHHPGCSRRRGTPGDRDRRCRRRPDPSSRRDRPLRPRHRRWRDAHRWATSPRPSSVGPMR